MLFVGPLWHCSNVSFFLLVLSWCLSLPTITVVGHPRGSSRLLDQGLVEAPTAAAPGHGVLSGLSAMWQEAWPEESVAELLAATAQEQAAAAAAMARRPFLQVAHACSSPSSSLSFSFSLFFLFSFYVGWLAAVVQAGAGGAGCLQHRARDSRACRRGCGRVPDTRRFCHRPAVRAVRQRRAARGHARPPADADGPSACGRHGRVCATHQGPLPLVRFHVRRSSADLAR